MPTVKVQNISERRRLIIEPVLEEICRDCDITQLTFSRYCAKVLLDAAHSCAQKRTETDVLSSSTFVLNLCLFARRLANEGASTADADLAPEQSRLREIGSALGGDNGSRLERLLADFYTSLPSPDPANFDSPLKRDEAAQLKLGPGLARGIALAASQGVVSAPALAVALVQDPTTGIAERLDSEGMRNLAAAISVSSHLRGGRHSGMQREAESDELALSIDDYATALSAVLRGARGEFTFALFGHWGSGKTTLIRRLAPLVEPSGPKASPRRAPSNRTDSKSYNVALHNAWKYRSPPEAWIFAFKTLADRANRSFGPIGRPLFAIRAAVHRKGQFPFYAFLLASALALSSYNTKYQIVLLSASLIGVPTLLYFASAGENLSRRVRSLFADHVKLTSSDEKLGMLALVGDDIEALLAAWVAEAEPGHWQHGFWTRIGLPSLFILSVSLLWIAGMHHWAADAALGDLRALIPVLPKSGVAISPGRSPALGEWFGLVFWCVLAFVMLVFPWLAKRGRPDRVLLVVDDLDRCQPGEMLNVIEGFRLLLDERAVQNRLQVLMLLDEQVLAHAIALRYATMIVERTAQGEADKTVAEARARREVVSEQNEKLFACHLRMPDLGRDDVEAVVAALASRELNELKRKREAEEDRQWQAERRRAQKEFADAQRRFGEASRVFEGVRDGAPTQLRNPDLPRGQSRWIGEDIRTGDVSQLATWQEAELTKRENKKTAFDNARRAGLTEQQRLDEAPWAVKSFDEAREAFEAAKERNLAYVEGVSDSDPKQSDAEPSFEETDVRFTSIEVEELRRFVPAFFQSIGRRPSPRAIRILLFKVQLCRLLLDLRHPARPASTHSIGTILSAFSAAVNHPGEPGHENEIIAIARQVI